jgi:GNAT superfamily N-acetyltransferase
MFVRSATPSDAAGIADVIVSIAELKSVATVPIKEVRARVSRALQLVGDFGASMVLVGVTEDGVVAGYCAMHWAPFLFFQGPECYISELFVRPGDRGSGLGTELLREAESRARQRGCVRLSLLNGKDSQCYKRGFYAGRNWEERQHMANFILPITKP